jgi:FAD/FMN-containing dehydrogenase
VLTIHAGIGGVDGHVVVDLSNFQQFDMDTDTWHATIGAGMLLSDVTDKLVDAGNRAMAHGVCPQVGIGGHATIGGLGPSSRMWGAALDHVDEVEVVLANGTITTAGWDVNPDLFFALKGAAAGFGIITSFKVHTEPAPGEAVEYSFNFEFGDYHAMADTFKAWQDFVSKPDLTRKFASQVTVFKFGLAVSGTFFGSQAEFDQLNLNSIFPTNGTSHTVVLDDWLGIVSHWAEDILLQIGGGIPAAFYSKSLAFQETELMSDVAIDSLFKYLDETDAGTLIWTIIFDLSGGAVNDVALHKTAYRHRDVLYFLQSYAIDLSGSISQETTDFVTGINDVITQSMTGANYGAYAGYVDPLMDNAQEKYWGSNLPRLESIKAEVDPNEVFWNPQSVRPAKS